ncbi:MAG: hypothetical protein M5U09_20035 [Gammaproteobacteria bacterium]|nr:hypothetical protein [Gammaproteobacteria bacterium]
MNTIESVGTCGAGQARSSIAIIFRKKSTRSLSRLCLATCLALASSLPAAASPSTNPDDIPEGLSAADWQSIRALHDAHLHAVTSGDDGTLNARNRAQRWSTEFNGAGFLTRPDHGAWSWGWRCAPGVWPGRWRP